VVRLLIEQGVDPSGLPDTNPTPLFSAVHGKHVEIVKMLLSAAPIHLAEKGDRRTTSLYLAVSRSVEICEILLLCTDLEYINQEDEVSTIAFHKAAANGADAIVRLFIAMGLVDGAEVNARGWTALTRAIRYAHETAVELLLEELGEFDLGQRRKYKGLALYSTARENGKVVLKQWPFGRVHRGHEVRIFA